MRELVVLCDSTAEEVRSRGGSRQRRTADSRAASRHRGRVGSALPSDSLRDSLEDIARPISRAYGVVRDGERFLAGYIDLLVVGGANGLSILDYKSDRATSQADIAAKTAHYAPHLDAYAGALELVTGRAITSTSLVFAHPRARTED